MFKRVPTWAFLLVISACSLSKRAKSLGFCGFKDAPPPTNMEPDRRSL